MRARGFRFVFVYLADTMTIIMRQTSTIVLIDMAHTHLHAIVSKCNV